MICDVESTSQFTTHAVSLCTMPRINLYTKKKGEATHANEEEEEEEKTLNSENYMQQMMEMKHPWVFGVFGRTK